MTYEKNIKKRAKKTCFFQKKSYILKERDTYKCRANEKPFNNKITNLIQLKNENN